MADRRAARSRPNEAGLRGGLHEIQRARIMAALVEVSRERGAARVTVAHVVERSGVSRRTFYEMFEDRDACFVAAFEYAVGRAAGRVLPAYGDGAPGAGAPGAAGENASRAARVGGSVRAGRGRSRWSERVRAGLQALLEFLDDEPGLGALCIIDALGAGPVALDLRTRIVRLLVDVVDEGRAAARAGLCPSRLTAEGVVGGVLSVLHVRLAECWPSATLDVADPGLPPRVPERSSRLVALLSPLMGMIVLPYLGPAAAAREAARAVPEARRGDGPARGNPLAGLGMRLTYRTVRVLMAIAAAPGASNRQIAAAAEVQDQGQISKLLARLEQRGLIGNDGSGRGSGEPNAWSLTARGCEVEIAIRQQTACVGS